MSNQTMIASALHLSFKDIKTLKLNKLETFDYTLHKVIYDLFDDVRTEEQKRQSVSSGFLYADKGMDKNGRKILILSNRQPHLPEHGELNMKKIADSFLDYKNYRFEVVINPTKRIKDTGKIQAIHAPKLPNDETKRAELTRQKITQWFITKTPHWGFEVSPEYLEVRDSEVNRFMAKDAREITLARAKIVGVLTVTDKAQFIKSFQQGIGRGRAFGCGLLQIVPYETQNDKHHN